MGLLSFFGRSKKKEKSTKPQLPVLDDATRDNLRNELKRDPDLPFATEWERTTNLEREVIDEYGYEGIKLVFEHRNSQNYHLLGSFPEDCPWHSLNGLSLDQCIDSNFDPIRAKIPQLIAAIKDRCEYIYAEKREQDWHLHYLLSMQLHDGRDYYRVYTGGSPKAEPAPNANLLSFQWDIPDDLKEFYAIHDGFGEIYDANFVMSSEDIRVMGEMMNPITEEQGVKPEDYSFDDLLEFFPDGAGNTQCFIRNAEGNNSTVDWDHEAWEISDPMSFYEFIDDRMSEIDEE